MRTNALREKLHNGEPVVGTLVSLPDAGIVEVIGYAGFDFVVIDTEHSPIDFGTLRALIAAAEVAGLAPLVRVGACEPHTILRVLDTGAAGIMAPHVKSRSHAETLVSSARYPPDGTRGVSGGSRAARYGLDAFADHARQSNRDVLTIALIEDAAGVEVIDEIVDVDGLDVVCAGPGDLSASLGVPGQLQSPTVQEYVQRVEDAVRSHPDRVLGCYVLDPAQVRGCLERGAHFVIFSQDSRVIFDAFRNAYGAIREHLD